MNRLAGKTALVTGGGSGIGLATAKRLLAEGARVALTGRTETKLKQAAESLQGGERVYVHAADVGNQNQVQALVEAVIGRLGPIDLLVNNAGLNLKERTFRELTPENWQLLLAGNLTGAFYCMKEVLPRMAERGGGLIVNINSVSGLRAGPLGGVGYNAAKFGLRGLAISVAAEEKASGVRITSIFPGEVETPILEGRPKPVTAEQKRDMLQPEDVADAVLFAALLPPRAWIPELVLMPAKAQFI
jgi:NAD(P)-dependent dehydrogenase (short-subunit alcohol dehydrogenase family)